MAGRVTSRVHGVYKESDYPGTPDEETRKDLRDLFEYIGQSYHETEEPEITGPHAGTAQVALSPGVALALIKATHAISRGKTWAQRVDLREVAVQVVNLHFKCESCFQSHLSMAKEASITLEQQAALPYWRTAAHMFSDEQKLVIEYTNAVVTGDVPEELFSRVVKVYGERGTIEFTSVIAMWSMWAMIINATRPVYDFGYGPKDKQ